jgi:hypothetical protein
MLTHPQYMKPDYYVVADIYPSIIFVGAHFLLLTDGLWNVPHLMLAV